MSRLAVSGRPACFRIPPNVESTTSTAALEALARQAARKGYPRTRLNIDTRFMTPPPTALAAGACASVAVKLRVVT